MSLLEVLNPNWVPKKTLHLVVTTLCKRDCEFCCNKNYDIKNLPYVTDEELKSVDMLCLTGGEPFIFANPCELGRYYHGLYSNIKAVIAYTNAKELLHYYDRTGCQIYGIDGLSISVKDDSDLRALEELENEHKLSYYNFCRFNRIYDFTNKLDNNYWKSIGYTIIHRKWQKDFKPADNCIFRRGN